MTKKLFCLTSSLGNIYFKGIILQPISRKKEPWKDYDKSKDEFLDFFQRAFREDIADYFNVNHKTEFFSEYLLIPYFTEGEKQCFGAYFIRSGEESSDSDYTWQYNIDYMKSFDFNKKIFNEDIRKMAKHCGLACRPHGSLKYYEINKISPEFGKYIMNLKK